MGQAIIQLIYLAIDNLHSMLLKYVYYKILRYFSKGDIIPEFSSLSMIIAFIFLFLVDLLLVGEIITEKNIIPRITTTKFRYPIFVILIILQYIILNYYLVKNKDLEYYQKLFKNEPEILKRLGNLFIVLLATFLFCAFVILTKQL